MTIYRVEPDVKNYQSFLPTEEAAWNNGQLFFDCTTRLNSWKPLDIYVLEPKLKKGNFFGLGPGSLVADSHAFELLRDLFEMSGEMLPLFHEGEKYYLINVTGCFNVLDQDRTQWEVNKKGVRFRITNYAFRSERLTESPLFKIPETCRGEILTVADRGDDESDFKLRVESAQLTGLRFKELWRG
jgi:hypothetical protein